MANQDKIFFEWEAPEFRHYDKGVLWYIIFSLVIAFLVYVSINKNDYFGASTVVILGLLVVFFARRKPNMINVKISNRGFHVDNLHVPYRYVKQFWIVDNGHHKTLNVETNTYLNNTLVIELHEQDHEPIKDFLAEFLLEHEDPRPSFSQSFSRRFRF